jgi:hypothetical protein
MSYKKLILKQVCTKNSKNTDIGNLFLRLNSATKIFQTFMLIQTSKDLLSNKTNPEAVVEVFNKIITLQTVKTNFQLDIH